MKKFLVLFLFLFVSVSYALDYTTQEELKKIEEETQKCIDKNYMTDYAMMQCSIEGTKKYKVEIDRTIKGTKKYLSKTQYEQYLKTQEKWEEFMGEYDKLLKQTYEKHCPPYLACLSAVDDRYEYTKHRAEDLSGFIGVLQLFKKEGVLDDELNFVQFE